MVHSNISSSRTASRLPSRGQASIEFLALMGISIIMLAIFLWMYSLYSAAAANEQRALDAEGTCVQVASFFGSFSALEDGAVASFALPKPYAGGNYTVWMLGDRSLVKVEYDNSGDRVGVGCKFPKVNVTNTEGNLSGATFTLGKNFMLKKISGAIVVAG